jgi:alpha-beta hydrolase superfamily lysophospholipase
MSGSQAMLNKALSATTAIIFVHGFNGSARGTWEEFPSVIRTMPEARGADAFFVNYPSTTESVQICAEEFRAFLTDILRDPIQTVVNPSLPRAANQRGIAPLYTRVVLVAHSMGAVVVRRAVLDLNREGIATHERDAIRLLFFAPADKGSELPELVASGLWLSFLPGAQLVGKLLVNHYRSLADLDKQSPALSLLSDDSKEARAKRIANGEPDDYLRAHVLHAHRDKVVVQIRFDNDRWGRPIAGQNHRTSCKPKGTYRRPADELRRLL